MEKLPNNLRVNEKGEIFCEDGQDLAVYLKASPLFTLRPKPPSDIVVISRQDFIRLCDKAWENENLILAA